jgi:Spy/CpxP family protein refolding chaperone
MKTMLTRTLALMLLAGTATFATQAGAEDGTTLKPTAGAKAGAQIEGGADVLRPSAEKSASDNAPGQQKKAGDVDTAAEAAPGQLQKAGEVDSASEAAPGQMKKGVSDETTASIDLSAEQRTQVREIIVESNVQPVNVDLQVSIGAVVPTTVTLHPLPPRIVEIVPAYESYRYFVLANGQIVIVEPATLEVVYVIRA